MESININFYSGKQWNEPELLRKYPIFNHAWNVGLATDIANERFFVIQIHMSFIYITYPPVYLYREINYQLL